MGSTGDMGMEGGRLQMVFCCSDRKEPKGLGMEEQRVKKVHLYTTQSSVVVTFCEILRFFSQFIQSTDQICILSIYLSLLIIYHSLDKGCLNTTLLIR